MKTFLFNLFIICLCFTGGATQAATYTAASTSESDVQAAVNLASVGDTVIIPSGRSSWTSYVTITNGIYLQGAGTNSTIIINLQTVSGGWQPSLFLIRLAADRRMEISGLKMIQGPSADASAITVAYGTVHPTEIVIHDCFFEQFHFAIFANACFGVVYDCTFYAHDQTQIKDVVRVPGYLNSSKLDGISPPPWAWNSTNYFVIEDCHVILTNVLSDVYVSDTEFPANYMFRYNRFDINRGAAVGVDGFDMHGEANDTELRQLGIVIYKNEWYVTGNKTVNPMNLAGVRGGAYSLIYSNTVHGIKATVGFTDNPYHLPLMNNTYAWDNYYDQGNGLMPFIYYSADGVTSNVNYFISKPPGFAQLPYPHPLRSGGGTSTTPSTNPVIVVSPSRLDFGAIAVGATNDLTLTVKNTGEGTLSGVASAAAPFSIVGGSTYTITSNETQNITIQYNPIAPGNAAQTVMFTGGGDASVAVVGSALEALPGLSFQSIAGTISAPFVTNSDDTISQPVQTVDPTLGGRAAYQFNITNAGDYCVYAFVDAPNDGANSFFANIDAEPTSPDMIWDIPVTVGLTNMPVTWEGSGGVTPQVWSLATGTHQLIIRGREAGAKLGEITIVPQGTFLAAPPKLGVKPY